MSYTVTRTHTRPNTEVNWYTAAPILTTEYKNWMNDNWIANNKLTMQHVFSEDGLTMTVTITCQDEQTWNDLVASPEHIAFQAEKASYNNANGIVQTTTYSS